MVQKLRDEEMINVFKQLATQYTERAYSYTSVLLSAFFTFLGMHYSGQPLDSSKIFSTLQLLGYIRTNVVLFCGIGIGFIFDLGELFSRMIKIFTIPEDEMRPLNE
jgi:ATP-binding cassette, subfamily C (CFTR/MRP), member 4